MSEEKVLLDYIKHSRNEGLSNSEIKGHLEEAGWDGAHISSILESLDKNSGTSRTNAFQKPVPAWLAAFVIIFVSGAVFFGSFLYISEGTQIINLEITLKGKESEKLDFNYGSWPAMENYQFFEKTKQQFQAEGIDFIEANLSTMKIRFYKLGEPIEEVPIISKGRPGSWWETPAGIYKVDSKIKNHFSSFAEVYLPWSLPFQGNFFIHGWPHYENGEPVPEGYSGGCIRLLDEDAEKIFNLSKAGTPVLVFEDSFINGVPAGLDDGTYIFKGPLTGAESYLVADLQNNFVFAEKAPDGKYNISPIVKLMTAVVAAEHINVERQVVITQSMLVETQVPRVKPGESFAIIDLLRPLLMESSNEAAKAIASVIGENRLITLMNEKARAIGMTETEFVDVSGTLSGNVSTLHDLFMFAKYLHYNRSFVLHMSMGNENRAVYGSPAFSGIENPNKRMEAMGMVGGITSLVGHDSAGALAVFELEMGVTKRPIVIIIINSTNNIEHDMTTAIRHIKNNFEL